jgi:hypothetical protein
MIAMITASETTVHNNNNNNNNDDADHDLDVDNLHLNIGINRSNDPLGTTHASTKLMLRKYLQLNNKLLKKQQGGRAIFKFCPDRRRSFVQGHKQTHTNSSCC